MPKLKLIPVYTLREAKKIVHLAERAKRCNHLRAKAELVVIPEVWNKTKRGGWTFTIFCKKCRSEASFNSDTPICEKCSSVKKQYFMQLEDVKAGIFNLQGKVLYFICPRCKNTEEYEVGNIVE